MKEIILPTLVDDNDEVDDHEQPKCPDHADIQPEKFKRFHRSVSYASRSGNCTGVQGADGVCLFGAG